MKTAIILAAGMGTRLNPLTNNLPKCLVEIDGTSILKRSLEILNKNGIEDTVIVVGYMSDRIYEAVGESFGDMKITYIKNRIFNETNNMYSLWLARNYLKRGCILIEGDVLFEDSILSKLLSMDEDESYWAVDEFSKNMDGCMLTTELNTSRIKKIKIIREKLESLNSNNFKSVGILKVAPAFGILLSNWLDINVKINNVGLYYDLIIAEHLDMCQIYACNIKGKKWAEIDDLKDLKLAESMFKGDFI